MTIDRDKITEIFYTADNFCQLYDRFIKVNGLARKRDKSKRKYHRDSVQRDCPAWPVLDGMVLRLQAASYLQREGRPLELHFMLTPCNVDDREPLRNKSFIEQIFGKLVGDKGYICRDLFTKLFVDGFTVNL